MIIVVGFPQGVDKNGYEMGDGVTMTKKIVEHITRGCSSRYYYSILSIRLVCI